MNETRRLHLLCTSDWREYVIALAASAGHNRDGITRVIREVVIRFGNRFANNPISPRRSFVPLTPLPPVDVVRLDSRVDIEIPDDVHKLAVEYAKVSSYVYRGEVNLSGFLRDVVVAYGPHYERAYRQLIGHVEG